MRRLVYAPKVWIFIRASNIEGRIYDVSSDVVRGSVTQNLGDVSSARFELRNRKYKWLREKDFDDRVIFLPMDLVTIWLQRVAGRPIQVFTGYLDEVPYYQAYPGNAVFAATCTLKKLAFNWFDPGLNIFRNWVTSASPDWRFDPATGEAINLKGLTDFEVIDGDDAFTRAAGSTQISDTGFGDLLGRFMVDIAGWSENDVLVSDIPAHVPQKAAKLYKKIKDTTNVTLEELSQYLGQLMSVNGWQGNPVTLTDDPLATGGSGGQKKPTSIKDRQGGAVLTPVALTVLEKVADVASKNNVPPEVAVVAALAFSQANALYKVEQTSGSAYWGYGLFAMRPRTTVGLIDFEGGVPLNSIFDPGIATDLFCKRLNSAAAGGDWVAKAKKGDVQAITSWIVAASGHPFPNNVDIGLAYKKAKQAVGTKVTTKPAQTPSPNIDPKNTKLTDPDFLSRVTDEERQTINGYYKNSAPELTAVLLEAKNSSSNLRIAVHADYGLNANQIFLTGPDSDLIKYFSSLKGKKLYSAVLMKSIIGTLEWREGEKSEVSDWPITGSGMLITVDLSKARAQNAASKPTETTTTPEGPPLFGGEGALTIQQLAAFSANAAFAANFAFDTNIVESYFLTGDKALMNDISCLDAVRQFCQASLRTFRSLPDGRFLAFYPDYFGAIREPYWKIHNVEIIDFGIQLNDEALATHVYVIGDTFPASGEDAWMNEVSSRGVATLTQAFMLNSFIEPWNEDSDDTSIGRLHDAFDFLQHFGARPHKEEQPLIRNSFYEFLMAWQKFMWLWSQQFATSAQFTFQPEVMAGGLIAFPDHDVQMFCESVTHNFDYESGFTTEAVLTAPSLTKDRDWSRLAKPGFALGGGVNTVGVMGN